MYLYKSCYYLVIEVICLWLEGNIISISQSWPSKIPIIPSAWFFLQQTLPRLYGGCDVNKCPFGTRMRPLSFSLLMNKSKIWLMLLVMIYYEIQPVEFSFHSTYLQVAKCSILRSIPPVFPLVMLVQNQFYFISWENYDKKEGWKVMSAVLEVWFWCDLVCFGLGCLFVCLLYCWLFVALYNKINK